MQTVPYVMQCDAIRGSEDKEYRWTSPSWSPVGVAPYPPQCTVYVATEGLGSRTHCRSYRHGESMVLVPGLAYHHRGIIHRRAANQGKLGLLGKLGSFSAYDRRGSRSLMSLPICETDLSIGMLACSFLPSINLLLIKND